MKLIASLIKVKQTIPAVLLLMLSFQLTVVLPAEAQPTVLRNSTYTQDQPALTENSLFENYFKELDQTTLERLVGHVVSNATTVVYDTETRSFKSEYLFHKISNISSQADSSAKVYLSGGNIRSIFSYLYRYIDEHKRDNSNSSVSDILNNFLNSKEPILMSSWRGVGSDLDLLIESRNDGGVKLINLVNSYINGSLNEMHSEGAKFSSEKLSFMRTAFLQGDIKEYEKQTLRASEQGGSSLDWLAFDVSDHTFKLPTRDPYVIKNFINGHYSYFKESKPGVRSDPDDTILRGVRPLFELPFLKIKDQEVYLTELNTVIKKIVDGKQPSEKALKQIHKMMRNGLWGGAKNRVYRKNQSDNLVDQSLKILSDLLIKAGSPYYFPEYVDYIDREQTRQANQKQIPNDLRMNYRDFADKYTDNGMLFHGTKNIENALSILRGGFYVSSETQGLAVYGKGLYTTSDQSLAEKYSNGGSLFKIKVREERSPVIINWEKIKNDPRILEIIEESNNAKRDIFDVLKLEYGVDIIVNKHVIVQNADVIHSMVSESDFVKIYISEKMNELSGELARPESLVYNFSKNFKALSDIRLYAISYGLNIDEIQSLSTKYIQANFKALKATIEQNSEVVRSNGSNPFHFKTLMENFKYVYELAKTFKVPIDNIDFDSFQRQQANRLYTIALDKANEVKKYDRFSYSFQSAKNDVLNITKMEEFLRKINEPYNAPNADRAKINIYKNLINHSVRDLNKPNYQELEVINTFINNEKSLGVKTSSLFKVDTRSLVADAIYNSLVDSKQVTVMGLAPEVANKMISDLSAENPKSEKNLEALLLLTRFNASRDQAMIILNQVILPLGVRTKLADLIIDRIKSDISAKKYRNSHLDAYLSLYLKNVQDTSSDIEATKKIVLSLNQLSKVFYTNSIATLEKTYENKSLQIRRVNKCSSIFGP